MLGEALGMPLAGSNKKRTVILKTRVKFVAVLCTISYQAGMNARIKNQGLCVEIRKEEGYYSILR